jgi:hypothetical protein
MLGSWKQRTMVGVALAAVVAGVVVAIVGIGGGSHRHDRANRHRHAHGGVANALQRERKQERRMRRRNIQISASYLGITRVEVRRKLRAGETLGAIAAATPGKSQAGLVDAIVAQRAAKLKAAVGRNRISQKQANARLAEMRGEATQAVSHVVATGAIDLSLASSEIGVPATQLVSERRAGKSLADSAKAHGRSPQQLIDALVRARATQIEHALGSARSKRPREQALLSTLRHRIRVAVYATPGKRAKASKR